MTSEHYTQSGVDKRLVRRLQKAMGIKYTTALRVLESLAPEERRAHVESVEQAAKEER